MLDTIGIAMNGVTGRMGYRQHLLRSILAIREQGGVVLSDGSKVLVEPILVGRNEEKLKQLAALHDIARWTTSLTEALAIPETDIYFDAQVTPAREKAILEALAAGKHIYTEKPLAESAEAAANLAAEAEQVGIKNGVVCDKLYLPGFIKLKRLLDDGFFGRILSVRGEFGYWVFEGKPLPAQRPSWNYRAEDGGGIVLDMFGHWSYLLESLFGHVEAVYARTATHIPNRWDEKGQAYLATADDAAYATFELAGGVVAQVNSSWAVRVNRDELVEFQVDGTHGSAVVGLWDCRIQSRAATPLARWDPDVRVAHGFRDDWVQVPDHGEFANGFKAQWEQFLRHVVEGTDHPHDFSSGVRGLRLVDAGLRSATEGQRVMLHEFVS